MAVKATAVTVGTTATRLDTVVENDLVIGQSIVIYVNSGGPVYLGASDVSVSNGAPVATGAWGPAFDLETAGALYGIVSAGTADVRVVETGV